MKLVHIVGARPNFIKVAPVHRALSATGTRCEQLVIHTGQHYDDAMSAAFFRELELPVPVLDLGIGSGTHAEQTARAMVRLEQVIADAAPDMVIVYGDVNSTLATALVCAKLQVPLAHVEAGLRSYDRTMPEEINRVVTDHLSQLLFCPSQLAVTCLEREGVEDGVHLAGDVMYDALLFYGPRASTEPLPPAVADLGPREYLLCTVHRAGNTDDPSRLASVFACMAATSSTVVFPVHPRTAAAIARDRLDLPSNVRVIPPAGYLTMLRLERNARAILTDSGGVQKEAYWLGVPCLTLREQTEVPETVSAGWNHLVGVDPVLVEEAMRRPLPQDPRPEFYGRGNAAERIATHIFAHLAAVSTQAHGAPRFRR